MAKNEAKKCLDWLSEQQEATEGDSLGKGGKQVSERLTQQRDRTKAIGQFRSTVDQALDTQKLPQDRKKELDTTYKTVMALSKRKEGCLETVSQIASMEDLVQGLSLQVDSKALHLVNSAETDKAKAQESDDSSSSVLSNQALAKASQNCIQAVRGNWRWLTQVHQCAQVHLRNAAAYHQFFHEAQEAEDWMNNTLSHIHLTFDRTTLQGDRADALNIQQEMKGVLSAFLQWQTKADYLFNRAREVVPVPQRTTALKGERPVLALTDYSDKQITFIEGEALFLMDNTDRKQWKVRNNSGEVGVVPAVIILIPSPYAPATDTALRLRCQLLALWTGSVKRLGYQLIAFMLLVFRDWNQQEVSLLQQLSQSEREQLMRALMFLETTLIRQCWQGYGDFQELQERIHRLIMIIEEASDDAADSNNSFLQTIVIQIQTLEELLRKYQDFWTFWETFKTIVELAQHPELLLICDKWEQLNYRATAHIVRFWDTSVDLAEGDLTKQTTSLALLHETPSPPLTSPSSSQAHSEMTIDEEHRDTTTETVSTSVTEEQYTYVVKGVLDPRDNKSQLDIQTAIMLGIVDQAQGLYINPDSGSTMTMKEAMSEGKVLIQALSKRKLREERNSYGLLTIKTSHEIRPYTIKGVRDPTSNRLLTVDEATNNGVLTSEATYRTATGETISLRVAIERGLLDVTYDQEHAPKVDKTEVVSKTYAVHGVVNQIRKKKVSFAEAVRTGLLDRSTGEYLHNVSNERIEATEAIMRGFIKARFVADPSKLDIDPRNQIIIQKMARAQKKLMREIHTIRAFKSMGKSAFK